MKPLLQKSVFNATLLTVQSLVIVLGLLLAEVGPFAVRSTPVRATSTRPLVPSADTAEIILGGRPVSISLPTLGLELDVLYGTYNSTSATWDINDTTAFFASPSSLANTSFGETLIYGHNTPNVFAPLHDLRGGEVVTIRTDTGVWLDYTYTQDSVVSPDEIDVFNFTGAPTLTLQTCSGDWNEYRRLFRFELTDWGRVL